MANAMVRGSRAKARFKGSSRVRLGGVPSTRSRRRSSSAPVASTPPSRNGSRHAQDSSCALPAKVTAAAAAAEASSTPDVEPIFAMLPAKPRRPGGAVSTR